MSISPEFPEVVAPVFRTRAPDVPVDAVLAVAMVNDPVDPLKLLPPTIVTEPPA